MSELTDILPATENAPVENDATPIPAHNLGDTVRASWNFSKHQLVANIAHCSPEGKEALVTAFMWCIDPMHPVHQKDFAARVGYSSNTVWKIFQGKYTAPDGTRLDVPRKLIDAIRSFLKLEAERFTGGTTDFVETPTYRRIAAICDLARESQTPAFIIGPSHCGKTTGLRQYVSANNHGRSVYCRIPAASGVTGLLRVIATAVGVSDNNNEVNLRRYIKRAITRDMLVALDEVHQLSYTYQKSSFFKALEVIREVYDETRCGMVLCGTKLLLEKIEGAKNAELEQLFNRGTHRLNLGNSPTPSDLKAILTANHLEFPDRSSWRSFPLPSVVPRSSTIHTTCCVSSPPRRA
jgi:DNA transposition AAA+ family ATPase